MTAPGSVPGAAHLAAIGPGLQAAGMLTAVVAVPAVFPDGRLPGRRWRWLAWSVAAAVTCLFLGNVLSPHAFMETWATIMNQPLQASGKIPVFGRGDNPVNFVSAADVAALTALASPILGCAAGSSSSAARTT